MSTKSTVDLKNNSKLYPNFIQQKYRALKIPEVSYEMTDSQGRLIDYCDIAKQNAGNNLAFKPALHQEFFVKIMTDPELNINEQLLFWEPGSGKTLAVTFYLNEEYKLNPDFVVFLLIKKGHEADPWLKTFARSLDKNLYEDISKKKGLIFHIIHYDGSTAFAHLKDAERRSNASYNWIYIIDESHNWIGNVYSNEKKQSGSQKASEMYHRILTRKKQRPTTKIILASGTPYKSDPYELVYTFNLMRPGIFNLNRSQFYEKYVEEGMHPKLKGGRVRNNFQRRISNLVLYYSGDTPEYFAKKINLNCNVVMSKYQYKIYKHFENIEYGYEKKNESVSSSLKKKKQTGTTSFNTFTKQCSFFVIPDMGVVNGLTRPRLTNYKMNKVALNLVITGNMGALTRSDSDLPPLMTKLEKMAEEKRVIFKKISQEYETNLAQIYTAVNEYFDRIKKASPSTFADLVDYKKVAHELDYDFFRYFCKAGNYQKLSLLTIVLYEHSPKYVASIFNSFAIGGKGSFFVNYVIGEGITTLKIYMRMFGYELQGNGKESSLGYFCEYHGSIPFDKRNSAKNMFNEPKNCRGDMIKFILLSTIGIEAIELMDLLVSHELGPDWDDNITKQYDARGWRRCSHSNLPVEERVYYHIKYFCVKNYPALSREMCESSVVNCQVEPNERVATDIYIENVAIRKKNFKNSFLLAMKESSTDYGIFRNHNMYGEAGPYEPFNFTKEEILSKNPGQAYTPDLVSDEQNDSGTGARNTKTERIKVFTIDGVIALSGGTDRDSLGQEEDVVYSTPQKYRVDTASWTVFGYKISYIVGKCKLDKQGKPVKLHDGSFVVIPRERVV